MKRYLCVVFTMMMVLLMGMTACAAEISSGQWEKFFGRHSWRRDDGTLAMSCWEWLDDNWDGIAECYYFDDHGFLLSNTTTPDGCTVDDIGRWTVDGVVQEEYIYGRDDSVILENYPGHWDGWKWLHDDGSFPQNTWEWIDYNRDGIAQCYYFDKTGLALRDTTTPDGNTVNIVGQWVKDGEIQNKIVSTGQWKQDSNGWWWQHNDGTYTSNGWEWVDDDGDLIEQCYYFDSNGYALMDTTTPDHCTVNASGAWTVDGVVQSQKVVSLTPVTDYIRSLYKVTQHPEWDPIIYNTLEHMEKEKKLVTFYSGMESECVQLRNYLDHQYGFTYEMRFAISSMHDRVVLADSDVNIEERLRENYEEAKKAEAVAVSLKADTDEKTIDNIINWVLENVEYDDEAVNSNDREKHDKAAYNVFTNKKTICDGFAKTVLQLCSINGIEAYYVSGRYNGESHAWNKIIFPDGERWVDTVRHTKKNAVSDTLWAGYDIIPDTLLFMR